MRHPRKVATAVGFVLVAWAQLVQAACVETTLAQDLTHPDIVAIFGGSVVETTPVSIPLPENLGQTAAQIVTGQVVGVWKGDVPRETLLYFRVGEARRLLEAGQEYLFITSQLSRFGRQQFGIPPGDDQRLSTNEYGCGAVPFDTAYARRVVGETRAYPPR